MTSDTFLTILKQIIFAQGTLLSQNISDIIADSHGYIKIFLRKYHITRYFGKQKPMQILSILKILIRSKNYTSNSNRYNNKKY